MKNLIFIGLPGSGKGTVSNLFKKHKQVSTGDLLRKEKDSGSSLGNYIKNLIDQGKFVSDEVMFNILDANLDKNESMIFDGYPRNVDQITYFERLFPVKNDFLVVYFNVNEEVVVERALNRWICSCGASYNLKSKKPKLNGVCDLCAKNLFQRNDDKLEIIKNRIKTFNDITKPVFSNLKDRGHQTIQVDASKTPLEIFDEINYCLKQQ